MIIVGLVNLDCFNIWIFIFYCLIIIYIYVKKFLLFGLFFFKGFLLGDIVSIIWSIRFVDMFYMGIGYVLIVINVVVLMVEFFVF